MIFSPQFKKIKSIRFLENLKNVKNQYKKFSLRFNFKKKGCCTCCADIKKCAKF